MSEVKRFQDYDAGMCECLGGDWVQWADFDRITTSLEQRRYAEQQAREAAERRAGELSAHNQRQEAARSSEGQSQALRPPCKGHRSRPQPHRRGCNP
jgi:hypothetical protein